MRKISLLLFIPLFFVLSCKKSETSFVPVVGDLDVSEAFKDVIFTDIQNEKNFSFKAQSGISYLGFVTDKKSVENRNFNPFNGVNIVNTGFSLTDVNGLLIKDSDLKNSVLSEYRTSVNDLLRTTNKSFLPKFSFKIYAPAEIVNSSKTNIVLVLDIVYYYLNLNQVTDNHLNLSPATKIDEFKAHGAYLSRIAYGQQYVIGISTDQNPKKVLTYLKAYINDHLYNEGKQSEELSKGFDIPSSNFGVIGGELDLNLLFQLDNKLKIKQVIKNSLETKAIKSPFSAIEFEFKSFDKVD